MPKPAKNHPWRLRMLNNAPAPRPASEPPPHRGPLRPPPSKKSRPRDVITDPAWAWMQPTPYPRRAALEAYIEETKRDRRFRHGLALARILLPHAD